MISRRLIRVKVIQSLYSHLSNESESLIIPQKNLLYSLDKCHELYYMMLMLPCEVADYAQSVIDSAKDKLLPTNDDINPNMRFVENPILAQLRSSKAIESFISKHSLSWVNSNDVVKTLYSSMIEKEYYKNYMSIEACNYNDHKNFIADFYRNEIEECDHLYDVIEDMSMFWADEIEYAASHALQTVASLSAQTVTGEVYKEIKLLPAYKDSEDQQYAKTLFVKAAAESESNLKHIESFTHNWDVERIAFMDKVIMLVAIAEIKHFADIPINVTLNEYIEISKYYSSNKSGVFINGILDKIIAEMKEAKTLPLTKLA